MSCPKCEPDAKSKRWVWWAGVLLLVAGVGWFENSRSQPVRAPPESQQQH